MQHNILIEYAVFSVSFAIIIWGKIFIISSPNSQRTALKCLTSSGFTIFTSCRNRYYHRAYKCTARISCYNYLYCCGFASYFACGNLAIPVIAVSCNIWSCGLIIRILADCTFVIICFLQYVIFISFLLV
mgnify:CR=1 FL=1